MLFLLFSPPSVARRLTLQLQTFYGEKKVTRYSLSMCFRIHVNKNIRRTALRGPQLDVCASHDVCQENHKVVFLPKTFL